MGLLDPDASPVLLGYLAFFTVSFLMLAAIGVVALPAACRKILRHFRLAMARRRRGVRMLADPERLESGALMLEGLYLVDENGPLAEVVYAEAESATGSGSA